MFAVTDVKMICVVAMAENHVIGDGTDLIWHLPGDLKRVKALTMGCPLIMGRKTYYSIGRPLPGRLNIVLTRNPDFAEEGVVAAADLTSAVQKAAAWLEEQHDLHDTNESRIILFGGGEIYRLGLSYCDMIEATIVEDNSHQGVTFPALDKAQWREEAMSHTDSGETHPAFRYVRLHRLNPSPAPLLDRLIP